MKKIIAISGSLRKDSFNTALLQIASNFKIPNCQIEIASIQNIPLYNQDDEQANGLPPAVSELKNKIIQADGLLISTPEYNRSIPGVLKNAVDWLSRPTSDIAKVFGNKPTWLIGVAGSMEGSTYAQIAWLPILKYLNVRPYFEKSFVLGQAHNAFDLQGKLKDPEMEKRFLSYLNNFVQFI